MADDRASDSIDRHYRIRSTNSVSSVLLTCVTDELVRLFPGRSQLSILLDTPLPVVPGHILLAMS